MADVQNRLHFGDNLDVLRRNVPSESVDLIYLDPPFKSGREYNFLYRHDKRADSPAQEDMFVDTWKWDAIRYEESIQECSENPRLAMLLQSFYQMLGGSEMMAYLSMMAPRLFEMHRTLRRTGSLFLHCDPAASHYLKVLMDAIFKPENFRNEVIWKRTSAHNSAKRFGPVHDTILFYSRSDKFTWNPHYTPYDENYVKQFYRHVDTDGRRYTSSDLTAAGKRKGSSGQPWRGIDPAEKGKGNHWKFTQETLDRLDLEGRILWPAKEGGMPRYKRFLDEMHGLALQDVFTDIVPVQTHSKERTGYATQKPLSLLERFISACSNPGDVVLDPFCGCGTAVVASQKLNRHWLGIDVAILAVEIMQDRLRDEVGIVEGPDYSVQGIPNDVASAKALFERGRKDCHKQFEIWAVGLVDGRPRAKMGADRGIDGDLLLQDQLQKLSNAPIQVKGGSNVPPTQVRDFAHVIAREESPTGIFISFERTGPAQRAAIEGGSMRYHGKATPRLQLYTLRELLEEKKKYIVPDGYRALPRRSKYDPQGAFIWSE